MKLPYLPEKEVKRVIIGHGYNEEIYDNIRKLGIEILFSSECANVLQGIRNHADIGVCQIDSDTFYLSKDEFPLAEKIAKLGFNTQFIDEDLGEKYPSDVYLNCVRVGKHIFFNPKTVSYKIREYINRSGLIEITVPQGYTKCSIAPVSADCIVTDDFSIGYKADDFGFDVLVIGKGDIKLKGFNYGFIGGSTGKISHDKMLITGNVDKLQDGEKIKKFLYNHDVNLIELSEKEVEDVGSIIPIVE